MNAYKCHRQPHAIERGKDVASSVCFVGISEFSVYTESRFGEHKYMAAKSDSVNIKSSSFELCLRWCGCQGKVDVEMENIIYLL